MTPDEKLSEARAYIEAIRGESLTSRQDEALIELVAIVAKGRDDKETTNYAYLTWQRVMQLAKVLDVIPLKTVLYLESLKEET